MQDTNKSIIPKRNSSPNYQPPDPCPSCAIPQLIGGSSPTCPHNLELFLQPVSSLSPISSLDPSHESEDLEFEFKFQ
jgi:hypothetical protein